MLFESWRDYIRNQCYQALFIWRCGLKPIPSQNCARPKGFLSRILSDCAGAAANNALELTNLAVTSFAVLRGLSFPNANAAPVAPSPLLLRRRGFGRGLRLSAAFNGQKKYSTCFTMQ